MKEKHIWRTVILWVFASVILLGAAVAGHIFLHPQWKETEEGRYYTVFCKRLFGWQEIDGKNYYFDPDTGILQTGWLTLPEGTYCLNTSGTPVTGWQNTASGRFHFGEDGRLSTGWLQDADGAVYLNEEGKAVSGWLTLPEGKYYLNKTGHPLTGWQDLPEGRRHFGDNGVLSTGWHKEDAGTFYLDEEGAMVTGWLTLDEGKYYLNEDGTLHTGWMQTDEARYYFLEDGTMAVGSHKIGEISRYFSSDGNYIPLVNPWNPVPEDYTPNLVSMGRRSIDSTCVPAFEEMEAAAEEAGLNFVLNSGYRTLEKQTKLWDKRYNKYRAQGYSKSKAYALTARRVAYPGTSEHHTGLAIDVMDLDGDGKLYAWFRDHAWEYGFVVRYRGDKESITGIMDEPWHLRYVGKEVSKILYEKDLCLEEFLGELPPQE